MMVSRERVIGWLANHETLLNVSLIGSASLVTVLCLVRIPAISPLVGVCALVLPIFIAASVLQRLGSEIRAHRREQFTSLRNTMSDEAFIAALQTTMADRDLCLRARHLIASMCDLEPEYVQPDDRFSEIFLMADELGDYGDTVSELVNRLAEEAQLRFTEVRALYQARSVAELLNRLPRHVGQ